MRQVGTKILSYWSVRKASLFSNPKRCYPSLQMSLFWKQESLDEFRTMKNILESLNRRLQLKQRKIILYMDDAPCYPASLQHELSNRSIVFLPKNTTSKTQPLDSGIIASWTCSYEKRLLCHVCIKVDGSNSASNNVKSVDLLMSMEWGRLA